MGKLKKMEGNVNADVYYRILRHQMAPSMKYHGSTEFHIFMQDNAPVRKAKKVLDFFQPNNGQKLDTTWREA